MPRTRSCTLGVLILKKVFDRVPREVIWCPWELLYADDVVIIAETEDDIRRKLNLWRDGMEAKGRRVNNDKTKILISGPDLTTLKDTGKHPCGVCRSRVGSNSIFCSGCSHWVHKKCSGLKGKGECWAPTKFDFLKLQRNDRAMIRWIYNIRLDERLSSDSLLRELRIDNLETLMRYNRLCWYGHVSKNKSWIKRCSEFKVEGTRERGRPRKTWIETINHDKKLWKLLRLEKGIANKHGKCATFCGK